MRLIDHEARAIKSTILEFDENATIYLFGSRADDAEKGGDIDLLIMSGKLTPSDKIPIKVKLFQRIEEQKIDIVIARDDSDPFVRVILKKAVLL